MSLLPSLRTSIQSRTRRSRGRLTAASELIVRPLVFAWTPVIAIKLRADVRANVAGLEATNVIAHVSQRVWRFSPAQRKRPNKTSERTKKAAQSCSHNQPSSLRLSLPLCSTLGVRMVLGHSMIHLIVPLLCVQNYHHPTASSAQASARTPYAGRKAMRFAPAS